MRKKKRKNKIIPIASELLFFCCKKNFFLHRYSYHLIVFKWYLTNINELNCCLFVYLCIYLFLFSVIHLFPWSGILDENYQLSETFQVPDIKTGKMVKLMTQLTRKEEEMFRNMIRRLNNIVAVSNLQEK